MKCCLLLSQEVYAAITLSRVAYRYLNSIAKQKAGKKRKLEMVDTLTEPAPLRRSSRRSPSRDAPLLNFLKPSLISLQPSDLNRFLWYIPSYPEQDKRHCVLWCSYGAETYAFAGGYGILRAFGVQQVYNAEHSVALKLPQCSSIGHKNKRAAGV